MLGSSPIDRHIFKPLVRKIRVGPLGEILPYARVHDERVERNALLVAVSEIPLVLGGLSELCYHQLFLGCGGRLLKKGVRHRDVDSEVGAVLAEAVH